MGGNLSNLFLFLRIPTCPENSRAGSIQRNTSFKLESRKLKGLTVAFYTLLYGTAGEHICCFLLRVHVCACERVRRGSAGCVGVFD